MVGFSVRAGRGVEKLMTSLVKSDKAWSSHVPSQRFNRRLGEATERNPRQASQVKSWTPIQIMMHKPKTPGSSCAERNRSR